MEPACRPRLKSARPLHVRHRRRDGPILAPLWASGLNSRGRWHWPPQSRRPASKVVISRLVALESAAAGV